MHLVGDAVEALCARARARACACLWRDLGEGE